MERSDQGLQRELHTYRGTTFTGGGTTRSTVQTNGTASKLH
jgi:hypothetical protein